MLQPEIDWNTCETCEPCQARLVCKTRAIVKMEADEPPYIDYARCNGCAKCVLACACSAIVLNNVPRLK